MFIGQGVGYLGNAATNVIMPLTTAAIAIGQMIGDGAAAYMSLNLGKNKKELAEKGVGNAISLTIGFGIIFLILFEIFVEPICWLFGATESNIGYSIDYGRIIVLGFPASAICIAFSSIIRADGRPNASMAGLLIGCVTNLILDPVFIFVFGWGVKGAAFATIIGQILNAIFFIVCLFRFKTIKLKRQDFIPDVQSCRKIISFGTSSFITQFALVIVMIVINNVLVKYGALSKYGADIPLAVLGIVMKVNQLLIAVVIGIATGTQLIWGYNYGSGQYRRVKQSFKYALSVSTLIALAALFIFEFFPEAIINIFGQESDLYLEFAVRCFRIYLSACFLIPAGGVISTFFQSIGKPIPAAIISLCRQIIILIPAVLIFSYLWGIDGFLWAGPFGDGVSGIISLVTIWAFRKKIFGNGGKENE